MFHVNDTHYDQRYVERCFSLFDQHSLLQRWAGERIAVSLADAALWVALCLYVKQRGGAVYPLPADLPIEAARRRAERSGCSHLIVGAAGATPLERIEAIESAESSAPSIHQASLIQTSSGTTGEPKFIGRSWASIDTEIDSYVRHFDASDMTPIVACPVTHSYGLISGVLVAIARGVAPVIVTNPNPKYILRKLSEASAPLLYSSPALIASITMLARAEQPIFAAMTSGALLHKSAFDSMRDKVRHVHQQYGCSEAGCVALGQDITSAHELGKPLPHVEVAAGDNLNELREIVVKVGDNTIATQDLGYFQADKLHFVSRIDDTINVSGLNVYPTEVEEAVLQMPGVSDAVVFKRSSGLGSDQVCLQFVAREPVPHRYIREWCGKKLASHQVPMRISQVQFIPKLPNGKVSRKTLAEESERSELALLSNAKAPS